MKKAVWTVAAVGTLIAGSTGGCQDSLPIQEPQGYVGSAVNDIRAQAAEELRKAFINEVGEFFKNEDLARTLGLDSDGQEKIEASIKEYISNYSMDEEKLAEAKESLDKLLENAQGLSADDLQSKIAGIFED
ncbi:MAG: hypothetical protein K2M91_05595 [Lachnospiraceae bacterium]|nr:hypothetical protein [Lachnospiraceae bacterium]